MGGQVLRAETEALEQPKVAERTDAFEAIFRAQYPRLARVIARVIRDQARAEDLAVEVFLKFLRNRAAEGDNPEGWLYRVADNRNIGPVAVTVHPQGSFSHPANGNAATAPGGEPSTTAT